MASSSNTRCTRARGGYPAARAGALLLGLLALAAPAAARDPASLEDLTIAASRVPDWHALDHLPLDTSGWTRVNVPCNGGNPSAVRDAISAAGPNTVLLLPANCRYVFDSALGLSKSRLVLRGASRSTSILEFTQTDRDMILMIVSGSPFSDARAWTSGYTLGSDVIGVAHTSGLTVGRWVRLKAASEPDWHSAARNEYVAKLLCVGRTGGSACSSLATNQVRLDRPLPALYDQGNQTLEPATGVYLEHTGIENLRIQHATPAIVEKYRPFVRMDECHECWITDSSFGDGGNSHIITRDVVRSVFRGNDFGSNQCSEDGVTCNWNKGAIYFNPGNADCVFENNTLSQSPSGPLAQGGAGTVIAYNFMRSGPAVTCERHVFLHGQGVTATLAEGNDVDCMMQWDSFRDGQGYYNTFYRNRLRGAGNPSGGFQRGRLGGEDTGSHIHRFIQVIGNHANEFMGSPQLTGRAIDESRDATHRHEDTWVSHNVARSTILFENSGAQVRTTQHENHVRSSPSPGWSNVDFPASLYRSEAPAWWCQESGPFPNIGAPSDRVGSYSRLPAQIRLEGGTCTPLDDVPLQPPQAPILLE